MAKTLLSKGSCSLIFKTVSSRSPQPGIFGYSRQCSGLLLIEFRSCWDARGKKHVVPGLRARWIQHTVSLWRSLPGLSGAFEPSFIAAETSIICAHARVISYWLPHCTQTASGASAPMFALEE